MSDKIIAEDPYGYSALKSRAPGFGQLNELLNEVTKLVIVKDALEKSQKEK